MTMQVPSKSPRNELSFNVQLLSGKNVVLVNCQGYESELFMPQIVRGRISFQNIIPNRRCCNQANITTGPLPLNGDASIGTGGKATVSGSPNIQRPTGTPLARSTFSMRSRTKRSRETISPPPGDIMTPDQLRSKPVAFFISEDLNSEELFSSFDGESCQLRLADGRNELSPGTHTPSTHTPAKSLDSTPCSVFRRTPPLRTYSRRKSDTTSRSKSSPSCSPLQKKKISSKASTTKGLQALKKLEIRHRKLIVDNKKCLGSLSVNKLTSSITKKKTAHNQVTAKTREQFESLKTTAFDLLTTPTHKHLSKTLNHQFQMVCVDKIATTLPNYVQLAPTKPLEIDPELRTMIAKQKRLEKTNSKPKWI